MKRIVIIGASVAGQTAAVELREKFKDCSIALLTEEPYPFYDRRQLFDFVGAKVRVKELLKCGDEFYRDKDIAFLKERTITSVNTQRRAVHCKHGEERETYEYDYLVVCSGRRFILPEIPGALKEGVYTFYSLKDAETINAHLVCETVCIIGSNEWAYTVAQALARKGKEVKIVTTNIQAFSRQEASALVGCAVPGDADTQAQPEAAQGAPEQRHGPIEVIDSQVVEIIGETGVQAVKLKEGKVISAEMVIYMDETAGNLAFLKNAGVEIEQGMVLVDEAMRTNVPGVYACGAVCLRKNSDYRLKSWDEVCCESKFLVDNLRLE